MAEKYDVMKKIIDETMILKSAIDIEDMDLIESALERRKRLLEILKTFRWSKDDEELSNLMEKFQKIDVDCKEALKAMEVKLKVSYHEHRVEKQKAQKSKKAMQGYHQVSAYEASGGQVDRKK